jgi:hypothetical protein
MANPQLATKHQVMKMTGVVPIVYDCFNRTKRRSHNEIAAFQVIASPIDLHSFFA